MNHCGPWVALARRPRLAPAGAAATAGGVSAALGPAGSAFVQRLGIPARVSSWMVAASSSCGAAMLRLASAALRTKERPGMSIMSAPKGVSMVMHTLTRTITGTTMTVTRSVPSDARPYAHRTLSVGVHFLGLSQRLGRTRCSCFLPIKQLKNLHQLSLRGDKCCGEDCSQPVVDHLVNGVVTSKEIFHGCCDHRNVAFRGRLRLRCAPGSSRRPGPWDRPPWGT